MFNTQENWWLPPWECNSILQHYQSSEKHYPTVLDTKYGNCIFSFLSLKYKVKEEEKREQKGRNQDKHFTFVGLSEGSILSYKKTLQINMRIKRFLEQHLPFQRSNKRLREQDQGKNILQLWFLFWKDAFICSLKEVSPAHGVGVDGIRRNKEEWDGGWDSRKTVPLVTATGV